MTEDELEDILFMLAPPRVPLTRVRLKLELSAKRMWDEEVAELRRDFPQWSPEPDDRPVLSPGVLYQLFAEERFAEIDSMKMGDVVKMIHGKQNGRFAEAVTRNDYIGVFDMDKTFGENMRRSTSAMAHKH